MQLHRQPTLYGELRVLVERPINDALEMMQFVHYLMIGLQAQEFQKKKRMPLTSPNSAATVFTCSQVVRIVCTHCSLTGTLGTCVRYMQTQRMGASPDRGQHLQFESRRRIPPA